MIHIRVYIPNKIKKWERVYFDVNKFPIHTHQKINKKMYNKEAVLFFIWLKFNKLRDYCSSKINKDIQGHVLYTLISISWMFGFIDEHFASNFTNIYCLVRRAAEVETFFRVS